MDDHKTASRLPADLPLHTPDGDPMVLRDLAHDGPLVIQLVRYFGCLPCQEWLITLDGAAGALSSRGARVMAIGGSAGYQARWLRDARGVSMPLLLDPQHLVRDAVGASDSLGLRLADPRGLAAYGRSLLRGARPQRITADTVRSPGVVILGRDFGVRWLHVGRRIGDYPPLEAVFDALGRLETSSSAPPRGRSVLVRNEDGMVVRSTSDGGG